MAGLSARCQAIQKYDRFWTANLCMRIIATVLALAALGGFTAAILISRYDYKYGLEKLFGILVFASLLWSFLWNLTAFTKQWLTIRPVNSGLIVAAELVSWIALAIVVALAPLCTSIYKTYYSYSPSAQTQLVLSLDRLTVCFAFLMALCHFVLFVIACRVTHVRNRQTKKNLHPSGLCISAPMPHPGPFGPEFDDRSSLSDKSSVISYDIKHDHRFDNPI